MTRPVLEYAAPVWDPTSQQAITALEKVQRRAARYVHNDFKDRTTGCVTKMLKDLNWDSLEERRRQSRLGMLFKIQNGLVDLDKETYMTEGDSRTRGARKLYQERTTHKVLYNSFFPRTVRQWNSLPTWITDTASLETFQGGLKIGTSFGDQL